MNIKEFSDLGFLQEANRRFFHPAGLSLTIHIDHQGNYTLHGIWDYRDDPEGVVLDNVDPEKIARVDEEMKRHEDARIALMGSAIQTAKLKS